MQFSAFLIKHCMGKLLTKCFKTNHLAQHSISITEQKKIHLTWGNILNNGCQFLDGGLLNVLNIHN